VIVSCSGVTSRRPLQPFLVAIEELFLPVSRLDCLDKHGKDEFEFDIRHVRRKEKEEKEKNVKHWQHISWFPFWPTTALEGFHFSGLDPKEATNQTSLFLLRFDLSLSQPFFPSFSPSLGIENFHSVTICHHTCTIGWRRFIGRLGREKSPVGR
jgi:hypothetical protein